VFRSESQSQYDDIPSVAPHRLTKQKDSLAFELDGSTPMSPSLRLSLLVIFWPKSSVKRGYFEIGPCLVYDQVLKLRGQAYRVNEGFEDIANNTVHVAQSLESSRTSRKFKPLPSLIVKHG
jgi:hypothetical protein